MKITADTNILVSGSFWSGDSFKILERADKKEIILVASKEIISEYTKVMNSDEIIEKIESKSLILSSVIQRVISNSIIMEPTMKLNIIKEDPDDNKILECAKTGKVDFIVTAWSSMAYEALLFKVHPIIIRQNGADLFKEYIDTKLFTHAPSSQNIIDTIGLDKSSFNFKEKTPYMETDKAKMKKIILDLLGK